ncbi:MAG: hypothetical protein ACRDRE_22490 [Pseudonocardiaceae bacterium]
MLHDRAQPLAATPAAFIPENKETIPGIKQIRAVPAGNEEPGKEIFRAHEENHGAKKLWWQLNRERNRAGRCRA